MMIEFLCPNGHKIRCPEERAGLPAKCPKCGVKFRIPDLSADDEAADDVAVAVAAGQVNGPSLGSAPAATTGQQIEFLCPNGHRLHGPASLQGRPGQCPECGSRFRIPSYKDVPEEPDEEADDEISIVGTDSDTKVAFDDTKAIEGRTSNRPPGNEVTTALRLESSGSLVSQSQTPSVAELLARLWAETTSDTELVLHLTSGETLAPSHFAKDASQGSHGLFAVEDSSGRLTLMAIAWDSITRMEVRGVKRLPDWMQG